MKKKVLSMILTTGMVLSMLAGCGSTAQETSGNNSETTTAANTETKDAA